MPRCGWSWGRWWPPPGAESLGWGHLPVGRIDSTAAAIEAVRDHSVDHGMLNAGADSPGADHPGFRELRTRVEKFSERLGLELLVTETSIRGAEFKWERLFSLCLGTCLHAQSGRFRVGTLGVDYSRAQDPVMFPWGGSHALCAVLGTDSFPILPLGTGLACTGKLASIIAFDPGLAE